MLMQNLFFPVAAAADGTDGLDDVTDTLSAPVQENSGSENPTLSSGDLSYENIDLSLPGTSADSGLGPGMPANPLLAAGTQNTLQQEEHVSNEQQDDRQSDALSNPQQDVQLSNEQNTQQPDAEKTGEGTASESVTPSVTSGPDSAASAPGDDTASINSDVNGQYTTGSNPDKSAPAGMQPEEAGDGQVSGAGQLPDSGDPVVSAPGNGTVSEENNENPTASQSPAGSNLPASATGGAAAAQTGAEILPQGEMPAGNGNLPVSPVTAEGQTGSALPSVPGGQLSENEDGGLLPINENVLVNPASSNLVPTGSGAESISDNETASVPLQAAFTELPMFGVIGTAMPFVLRVTGGIPPYTVHMNGCDSVTDETVTDTFVPVEGGETCLTALVTDSQGTQITAERRIPVSERPNENRSAWENAVRSIPLSGNWMEDLIAVAASQIGYRESESCFVIDESGKRHGYTRYGDYYHIPYTEWCALFAEFCLEFAHVPGNAFPRAHGSSTWVQKLRGSGLFRDRGEIPARGDLIFFSFDDSAEASHVGIISSVSGDILQVIQGNANNAVMNKSYDRHDSHIVGFGDLQSAYRKVHGDAAKEQMPVQIQTGEGKGIILGTNVRVREQANTNSAKLATIPQAGTEVRVLDAVRNESEIWYQVVYEEQTGYIRSDLIRVEYETHPAGEPVRNAVSDNAPSIPAEQGSAAQLPAQVMTGTGSGEMPQADEQSVAGQDSLGQVTDGNSGTASGANSAYPDALPDNGNSEDGPAKATNDPNRRDADLEAKLQAELDKLQQTGMNTLNAPSQPLLSANGETDLPNAQNQLPGSVNSLSDFLKEEEKETGKQGTFVQIPEGGVSLYADKDTAGTVLAVIPSGTSVLLVEQDTDYCQIELNQMQGYVLTAELIPEQNLPAESQEPKKIPLMVRGTHALLTVIGEEGISLLQADPAAFVALSDRAVDAWLISGGSDTEAAEGRLQLAENMSYCRYAVDLDTQTV